MVGSLSKSGRIVAVGQALFRDQRGRGPRSKMANDTLHPARNERRAVQVLPRYEGIGRCAKARKHLFGWCTHSFA